MDLQDDIRGNSSPTFSTHGRNEFSTLSQISSHDIARPSPQVIKMPQCTGCCKTLYDRWLLKVGDQLYHMSCLRCCACLRTLDNHASCFVKNNEVFCRYHYYSRFGPKCMACNDILTPTDWVRRESGFIYHVDCFSCRSCKRNLNTADTYVMINNGIFCPDHYMTSPATDDDNISVSSVDSDIYGSESSEEKSQSGKRSKRTTFTQQQVMMLQNAFSRNPSPSIEELEHIAETLNQPKRAIMVWFQNCRARHKKRLLSDGITSSSRSKMTENCHWIANPCSPDTIPFME